MSLKIQVLRGGTYFILRQGLRVIISFGGEILSFVKIATGRISIATLACLQENREQLLKTMSEAHGPYDLSLGVSLSSSQLDCPLAYSSRVRFPLAPSERGLSFYLWP